MLHLGVKMLPCFSDLGLLYSGLSCFTYSSSSYLLNETEPDSKVSVADQVHGALIPVSFQSSMSCGPNSFLGSCQHFLATSAVCFFLAGSVLSRHGTFHDFQSDS